MERPNRDKILQELKDMNHVAYGSYVEQEYHKRLELYVTHLEKQLLLHNVVVPKGTFCNLYKKECMKEFCSVTPHWQKCKHLE